MKEKKSDNLAYEYWFAGIRALSAGKKWKLHEQLKSGENIYYIEETKLKSLGFLTEKDISALNAACLLYTSPLHAGGNETAWNGRDSGI